MNCAKKFSAISVWATEEENGGEASRETGKRGCCCYLINQTWRSTTMNGTFLNYCWRSWTKVAMLWNNLYGSHVVHRLFYALNQNWALMQMFIVASDSPMHSVVTF